MENNLYLINSYEYDCRAICKEHCVTLAVTGFLIRGRIIFTNNMSRQARIIQHIGFRRRDHLSLKLVQSIATNA